MAWPARLFSSACWLLLLPSSRTLAEAGNREEKVESDNYLAEQAERRFTLLWAAAELEVEEDTPTEPGCYFKMPSGCPRHPNVVEAKWDMAKWKHDGFGERKKHAGKLRDVCEHVRKDQFDNFCGIDDSVMTFVPTTKDTDDDACLPHADDAWLGEDELRGQFNHMTVEDILTENIVYIRHNGKCPGRPQYFVKSAGQSFANYRFVPDADRASDSSASQGDSMILSDGARIEKARHHSARGSPAAEGARAKSVVPKPHELELIRHAPRPHSAKRRPRKHVERHRHKVPRKAMVNRRGASFLKQKTKKTVLADSRSDSFDEGRDWGHWLRR